MDFDDPFSELAVAKAPTTSRFQPKAKPRPKKGPSAVVKATEKLSVTSLPQDPVSNQSVQSQPNDNLEEKSADLVSLSFTVSESLVNVVEDGNLFVEAKEMAGQADIEHSEVVACNTIRKDLDVDTSSESQLPTDIIGLSSATAELPAETPMLDASSIQNEEEIPVSASVSFPSASTLRPYNSLNSPDEFIDKTFQDSEYFKGSIVGSDGDFQIDVEQVGSGDFSSLDNIEKRAAKYHPKPKAQHNRKRDSADVLHMRSDGNFTINSSVCHPGTVLSEDTETLCPEDQQQGGEDPEERESHDALDSSAKSVAEGINPGYEGNANDYDMVDGMDSGIHDNSSLHDRVPDEVDANRDREESSDGEHIVEEPSQKKRAQKSKKVASENDKPARKRRKAVQSSDDTIVKPPKKFPRGTRRKRCVDKSLLEVPEDELDLQRVPIKDLILLAEYKERQSKKEAEAAASLPPPTSERTENMFTEDSLYDDNETFGFDQDGDNPSTSGVVTKDTGYYNYQTYMKKEPRARWTKHDTELFYQAISQFGSDLSMIQLLFPGRTRHQIKLKYKKEERQNPMRLNDALTNRAQDLSHFELVIAKLQEQAAQEAKSDQEDSVCPTGKDEGPDENVNTNDIPNSEQNKEGGVADQELDKSKDESPERSYYSDDEDFDWSAYKSEL